MSSLTASSPHLHSKLLSLTANELRFRIPLLCTIGRCIICAQWRPLHIGDKIPHLGGINKMQNTNMTLQDKVGKAIVQLRKGRGISQETFAFEAGIDRRYMSDIENGKRNISLDILERVCQQLGIKISEFFVVVEKINE